MSVALLVWLAAWVLAGVLSYTATWWPVLWQRRRHAGRLAASLWLAGLPFVAALPLPVAQRAGLAVLQLWLVFCAARLVSGRLQEEFLRRSTRRSLWLAALAAAGIAASTLLGEWLLPAILGASLLTAWVFAAQIVWTLRHYRLPQTAPLPDLRGLPTVTLAIPARNETHALSECLAAAVASDYPKLEILVLDDCSQDKTPELIRSFAQAGVRFIQGEQPSDGWLGKNNAMRALAAQASGDYIVFADVDTRLAPGTISRLVAYALAHRLDMVSVLARRREGPGLGTVLWQLKYYWQVALPLTKRRVPVASQCWLIVHDELRRLGGFQAVRQKIVPEGYFARRLFAKNTYRFIISDAGLGVTTAKKWSSQNDTALRLLYPTCKRQPLLVLAACAAAAGMLAPFAYLVYALFAPSAPYRWLAAGAAVLYLAGYAMVAARANPRAWPLTVLCFAASLAQELILLVASMVRYEFGEVDWKGRNVCYPVLAGAQVKNRQEGTHGRWSGKPGAVRAG